MTDKVEKPVEVKRSTNFPELFSDDFIKDVEKSREKENNAPFQISQHLTATWKASVAQSENFGGWHIVEDFEPDITVRIEKRTEHFKNRRKILYRNFITVAHGDKDTRTKSPYSISKLLSNSPITKNIPKKNPTNTTIDFDKLFTSNKTINDKPINTLFKKDIDFKNLGLPQTEEKKKIDFSSFDFGFDTPQKIHSFFGNKNENKDKVTEKKTK